MSTGRGHWLEMSWNRTTGAWGVDCPGPPWHWAQARSNTTLPCSSRRLSGPSGSGKGVVPSRIGVRQGANTMVGEQHSLKRSQVVEKPLRRCILDLGVIGERTERLLLKRRHAGVQLVSAGRVRSAWPRIDAVRAREGHVVDGGNAPPEVHERLGRRRARRGIDELDVRGQGESDPDQAVLAKVAEIARALAVRPEIVRVDRPKQGIVGTAGCAGAAARGAGTSPPRRRARADMACPYSIVWLVCMNEDDGRDRGCPVGARPQARCAHRAAGSSPDRGGAAASP